ncbi:cytochrome-c peroxidase [Massilia sp. SM-13]|uniref:cytochrome-c peroxidase n=1 Tax=Pseudoduganella rhizocola TaxID=3382643 RepID=UPI0038B43E8E
MNCSRWIALALTAATLAAGLAFALPASDAAWSSQERAILATLQLSRLPAVPNDPSNRVEAEPAAIALGKRLFFDQRLSSNGAVSCASCHDPGKQFQDGRALAQGVATGMRRTMPVPFAGHAPFLFWDGRKDSLWAQAVGPLEDPAEHGSNRLALARLMQRHYRQEYEVLFGALPVLPPLPADAGPFGTPAQQQAWLTLPEATRLQVSGVLANIGKAIAAYEKTLRYGESRLDRYLAALAAGDPAAGQLLTTDEMRGLRIFIGAGRCVTCHNGPLLTDQQFHNTGIAPHGPAAQAAGRRNGVPRLRQDEFNCQGPHSDRPADQCTELLFLAEDGPLLEGAFKTPGLRNVALRAPYMHAGQLATLDEVIEHYRKAAPARVGRSELRPVALSSDQMRYLAAFLHTLSGPVLEGEHSTKP